MANNDTVLKDEVAELASQDIPELADRNRNSLMLLTLFLIKTKDWDGNYKLVKFILKDLTVFEVCKLQGLGYLVCVADCVNVKQTTNNLP